MNKKAYFINYCRLKEIAPSTGEWHIVYHNGIGSNSASTSTQTFNRDTIPDGVSQIQIRFPFEASFVHSTAKMVVDNREKLLTFNGTYYVTEDGSTTIIQTEDNWKTYYIENVTATNFRIRVVSKNSYTYGATLPTVDIEVFYVTPQWHTLWEGSTTSPTELTYNAGSHSKTITFNENIPNSINEVNLRVTFTYSYASESKSGKLTVTTNNTNPNMQWIWNAEQSRFEYDGSYYVWYGHLSVNTAFYEGICYVTRDSIKLSGYNRYNGNRYRDYVQVKVTKIEAAY